MARQGLAYPPGGEGSEGSFHHDFIAWSCRGPLGCGRSQKQSQAKRGASSLSLPSVPPPRPLRGLAPTWKGPPWASAGAR